MPVMLTRLLAAAVGAMARAASSGMAAPSAIEWTDDDRAFLAQSPLTLAAPPPLYVVYG